MPIGGLDIGSTGAKITVLSERGEPLYSGYKDYPISRHTSEHEVDPRSIWEAAKSLISGAAAAVPGLSAIGITSFGESFVLLDERDEVLAPSLIYTDPRGTDEVGLLKSALGHRLQDITGATPHAMYSLPKLMWVARNNPELFRRARRVCLIADYVAYMLTGNQLIDYSLAARTMGFDIHNMDWSAEVFDAAGLDSALFGKPVPSGTDAGAIKQSIVDELGLGRGLRVTLCCHDQVAAAVGAGVLSSGVATDGAGTVQCVTPVFSSMPHGHGLQDNNYSIVPFVYPGTYCCYAFLFTGGSLVNWFIDNLARDERRLSKERGISVFDLLESRMADAPTGILALPHFAGAATPYMDSGAKGAIVGLTLGHNVSDIYRSILEGITYEVRLNIDALASAGVGITSLNATGGCAKSRMWLQMKADILGIPITKMSVDEAGTVGGIMLTGVAIGLYGSLRDAASALVRTQEVFEPRPFARDAYEPHYQRYRRLYGALRPLI